MMRAMLRSESLSGNSSTLEGTKKTLLRGPENLRVVNVQVLKA